ncbi:hypothetical protein JI435_307780, partial [Parastagonospora nodorum SN15]
MLLPLQDLEDAFCFCSCVLASSSSIPPLFSFCVGCIQLASCLHSVFLPLQDFTMEDPYDARYGSIESHIDAAGFQLVNLNLPSWYINPDIKVAFASLSQWDNVVRDAPLQVAPGLAEVLSSSKPPGLDFFRRLPKPPASKLWAVYALILEHLELEPVLYIGSGTSASAGVQGRHTGYLTGSGNIPVLVKLALNQGYSLCFGMLCWTPLPPPQLVPRLRARFLALESVFAVIFCACVKMIMDDVFIPDFFLWSRAEVTWKPGCTHLSLSESVRADLELTEEELVLAHELRLQRNVAKTQRCRKRKREEDEELYLQNNLAQHQAWSERNPGRVNEIAADVRNKAKDLQRFRCEVCDHNAATQHALDSHLLTKAHLDAEKAGRKVLKPLSAAALNRRASREAAIANRVHYCAPCDKACTSSTDLKRHKDKQKHKDIVARQQARKQ